MNDHRLAGRLGDKIENRLLPLALPGQLHHRLAISQRGGLQVVALSLHQATHLNHRYRIFDVHGFATARTLQIQQLDIANSPLLRRKSSLPSGGKTENEGNQQQE